MKVIRPKRLSQADGKVFESSQGPRNIACHAVEQERLAVLKAIPATLEFLMTSSLSCQFQKQQRRKMHCLLAQ